MIDWRAGIDWRYRRCTGICLLCMLACLFVYYLSLHVHVHACLMCLYYILVIMLASSHSLFQFSLVRFSLVCIFLAVSCLLSLFRFSLSWRVSFCLFDVNSLLLDCFSYPSLFLSPRITIFWSSLLLFVCGTPQCLFVGFFIHFSFISFAFHWLFALLFFRCCCLQWPSSSSVEYRGIHCRAFQHGADVHCAARWHGQVLHICFISFPMICSSSHFSSSSLCFRFSVSDFLQCSRLSVLRFFSFRSVGILVFITSLLDVCFQFPGTCCSSISESCLLQFSASVVVAYAFWWQGSKSPSLDPIIRCVHHPAPFFLVVCSSTRMFGGYHHWGCYWHPPVISPSMFSTSWSSFCGVSLLLSIFPEVRRLDCRVLPIFFFNFHSSIFWFWPCWSWKSFVSIVGFFHVFPVLDLLCLLRESWRHLGLHTVVLVYKPLFHFPFSGFSRCCSFPLFEFSRLLEFLVFQFSSFVSFSIFIFFSSLILPLRVSVVSVRLALQLSWRQGFVARWDICVSLFCLIVSVCF